jgi:predicted nucleic-acid-binding protein
VWIATVVLVEVAWVLRSAYGFDRPTIAATLRRLLGSEGVWTEDETTVLHALDQYEADAADLSDYVILAVARNAHALPLNTFDERLARAPDTRLVP